MTDFYGKGVHDLSPEQYHADPTREPSLSSSIAKILLEQSPRHAWTAHPRLNPNCKSESRKEFDLGSAAHTLLLGDERRISVIELDDYRTKEAREKRDAAYAAGVIPVLLKHWHDVQAMSLSARQQLDQHEAKDAFTDGKPEKTLIWQEGDIWCRAMLDWLPNDRDSFEDYKSTNGTASPDFWQRNLFTMQYDVQAAFYRRGIRAVLGIRDPSFRFVIQETSAPYALSVVGLTPAALDMADRKVDEAIKIWSACQKSGIWPGYTNRIAYVDPLPWQEARWLEREVRNEQEPDILKRAINWQAPL